MKITIYRTGGVLTELKILAVQGHSQSEDTQRDESPPQKQALTYSRR